LVLFQDGPRVMTFDGLLPCPVLNFPNYVNSLTGHGLERCPTVHLEYARTIPFAPSIAAGFVDSAAGAAGAAGVVADVADVDVDVAGAELPHRSAAAAAHIEGLHNSSW
jgi:hypothetical protein